MATRSRKRRSSQDGAQELLNNNNSESENIIKYYAIKQILVNATEINKKINMMEHYFQTTLMLLYVLELSQIFTDQEKDKVILNQFYFIFPKQFNNDGTLIPISKMCVTYLKHFQKNYWCRPYDIFEGESMDKLLLFYQQQYILYNSNEYNQHLINAVVEQYNDSKKQQILNYLEINKAQLQTFQNYKQVFFANEHDWKPNISALLEE